MNVLMETTNLLSTIWICLMLTYLLGDVLRIFGGDFKPGEMSGKKISEWMMMMMAMLMLIPIIMILLSSVLPQHISRWANIIAASFLLIFNSIGLPTYPKWYDRFLIVVGLLFNVVTVWIAWSWN